MITDCLLYTSLLEVKQTSAYEIIGNLNKELEEQGYLKLESTGLLQILAGKQKKKTEKRIQDQG